MSFQKLKNYKGGEEKSQMPKNPYATAKSEPPAEDGFKTNQTLIARIHELSREIKELKQDMATLFICIQGDTDSKMTAEQSREIYSAFKKDPAHIMNRITDKINLKTGENNL